jgi:DNA-binding transcriptional LysR family regulator
VSSTPLLELPLILLVPAQCTLQSADELWAKDRIEESLICLPPDETVPRQFQLGLRRQNTVWTPQIEVSSLGLIETYVSKGYGIGLYVSIPRYRFSPGIRPLPLPGFPSVTLGALWVGKPSPLKTAFVEALTGRIREFTSGGVLRNR